MQHVGVGTALESKGCRPYGDPLTTLAFGTPTHGLYDWRGTDGGMRGGVGSKVLLMIRNLPCKTIRF